LGRGFAALSESSTDPPVGKAFVPLSRIKSGTGSGGEGLGSAARNPLRRDRGRGEGTRLSGLRGTLQLRCSGLGGKVDPLTPFLSLWERGRALADTLIPDLSPARACQGLIREGGETTTRTDPLLRSGSLPDPVRVT
jgi:hypothetical protein